LGGAKMESKRDLTDDEIKDLFVWWCMHDGGPPCLYKITIRDVESFNLHLRLSGFMDDEVKRYTKVAEDYVRSNSMNIF